MANLTILSYETIDLTALAPTGEAVGDLDGVLVYVPFGLPGERVRVEIVERQRALMRARLVEVIAPVPERVAPLCDYFGRCGGCDWQHMRYAKQLVYKRDLVMRELTETAKIATPEVRECVASFHAYDYRNSAIFSVVAGGRPAYAAVNPKEKIAVDECPILEPALEDELHKAALVGVGTRREWAIRVPEPIPVGNFDYYVGPTPFPVNTLVAEQMVNAVVEAVEPQQEYGYLDLNCGMGLFTLPLAVMSADVVGVEPNADAGREARRNVAAIRYRLFNKVPPRILTATISAGLARPEVKARAWQGVVLSTTSREVDLTTSSQIAKLGVARLVLVASEVATLGRSIKALTSRGFRMEYAQPLDMMPHTRQVTTVVRLSTL